MKMKYKKDKSGLKLLVAFIVGLFFFIKSCCEDRYIQQEGIKKTVTVSHYKRVKSGKTSTTTYSFGYFRVGLKQYIAYTDTLTPIGTKFEIKYNPKDPNEWRRTKRIIE